MSDLFGVPENDHCVVCKQVVYMVPSGTGDIYCTRHSKEFHQQFVGPTVKFCDHCKNSGNDPHVHFLGDIKRCYCGSYRPCEKCR